MTIIQLFKNLRPFVKPYRSLVVATLLLTLVGSFTSQVNALILQYTVDSINGLVEAGKGLKEGLKIISFISIVLMTKEILNAFITFGQKYYGEKLRILVSQDLAQTIIEKILTYRMAFYTNQDNQEELKV